LVNLYPKRYFINIAIDMAIAGDELVDCGLIRNSPNNPPAQNKGVFAENNSNQMPPARFAIGQLIAARSTEHLEKV
jgi:hypothetical protein